jgi:hypothetical protein
VDRNGDAGEACRRIPVEKAGNFYPIRLQEVVESFADISGAVQVQQAATQISYLPGIRLEFPGLELP